MTQAALKLRQRRESAGIPSHVGWKRQNRSGGRFLNSPLAILKRAGTWERRKAQETAVAQSMGILARMFKWFRGNK